MTHMMRLLAATAAAVLLSAGPTMAASITWTDWTGIEPDEDVEIAIGSLATSSGVVDVTYAHSADFAFLQTGQAGETDYWTSGGTRNAATSPYTSVGSNGVDNIPGGTDIVALSQPGMNMIMFSKPVTGVYLSLVSFNGANVTFNKDFEILSDGNQNIDGNGTDGCGFWGCGSISKQVAGGVFRLIGTGEAHGTIFFPGTYTQLVFNDTVSEFWHGLTIGVAGAAVPSADAPLPAALPLLASALAAVGVIGRGRRRKATGALR